jgi:hypothetical protein
LKDRICIVSGKDQPSPVSTTNKDEPLRGSLIILILDPLREAATWKTGLNGGFGFMAITDLVFLGVRSTWRLWGYNHVSNDVELINHLGLGLLDLKQLSSSFGISRLTGCCITPKRSR